MTPRAPSSILYHNKSHVKLRAFHGVFITSTKTQAQEIEIGALEEVAEAYRHHNNCAMQYRQLLGNKYGLQNPVNLIDGFTRSACMQYTER